MYEVIVTIVVPEKDGEPAHTEVYRYEIEGPEAVHDGIDFFEDKCIAGGQLQG